MTNYTNDAYTLYTIYLYLLVFSAMFRVVITLARGRSGKLRKQRDYIRGMLYAICYSTLLLFFNAILFYYILIHYTLYTNTLLIHY
jgi:hypothetical protein